MFSTMLFLLVIFTVHGMELEKCFLNAHGNSRSRELKAWRDLVRIQEAEENQYNLPIIAKEAENELFGLDTEENQYSSPEDLFDTFFNLLTTGKVVLKKSAKGPKTACEILKRLKEEFAENKADLVSNRFRNQGMFSALLNKLFPNLYLDLFLVVKVDDNRSFAKYLFVLFRGLINKEFEVQLATGIGGSADKPNIRICSYAIAGFQFLQKVVRNGIENFRFRLFSAYNAKLSLDLVKANDGNEWYQENAEDSLDYFYFYLQNFYPSVLNNYVSFEHDSVDSYELIKTYAEGFEQFCQTDNECASVQMRVREMAQNNKTTYSQSLKYAFIHPFLFGDVLINNDLAIEFKLYKGTERFQNPNAIISLGGTAERSFNGVRDATTRYMQNYDESSFPEVARLITKSGSSAVGKINSLTNRCVYYSVEGDISCKQFAESHVELEELRTSGKKLCGDIKVIFDDLKEQSKLNGDSLTDDDALVMYKKFISKTFQKIALNKI